MVSFNFNNPADLNNDGDVDVVDLALLGENWLNNKAKGDYVLGDISGSEGKPDGVVNLHDFAELSRQYLAVD